MLRCQKCQTAMNYNDDLTLPQIHFDILDIGKFFPLQILLQKMLFLKKKKIYVNSTCEGSINVFASILHWRLRPGHLLAGLQECSPWAQSHPSVGVPTQHRALHWICLISNSTCCNLGWPSFCAACGLLVCCWLNWNVSPLLFKELNGLSPVQITWVSHWRLKAALQAHRTSSKWVKPFLESNLRHKANSYRWTRWIPSFPRAEAELQSSG